MTTTSQINLLDLASLADLGDLATLSDLGALGDLGALDLVTLGEARETAPRLGYALGRPDLAGRALLTAASCGVELVYRLKDRPAELGDEIAFWGGLLARLAEGQAFDVVTHAPSSGKRPPGEHLATLLARSCAAALGCRCETLFVNDAPRCHRASIHEKLREQNTYRYLGEAGLHLLLVDDVIHTGSTMRRCWAAAGDAQLFALVLYKAGGV